MAKNPNKIRAKRVASDYVIDIIMIVTIDVYKRQSMGTRKGL